jgi:hypothetical protein
MVSKGDANLEHACSPGDLHPSCDQGSGKAGLENYSPRHDIAATLILAGPSFDPEAELVNPRLLDITPTLLHLMGQPVAQDMSGRVLFEAWREATTVETVVSYGNKQMVEVAEGSTNDAMEIERLRTLGYLQ